MDTQARGRAKTSEFEARERTEGTTSIASILISLPIPVYPPSTSVSSDAS
jgi:hypothetical protein